MVIEMKIPSPGESITEVEIARWLVEDGAVVEKDDTLCEIDSDKATLELNAEESGKVKIIAKEGEKIAVGTVACSIDTSVQAEKKSAPKKEAVAVAEKKEGKKDQKQDTTTPVTSSAKDVKATPVAKEMIAQNGIKADGLKGSGPGGRIIKADIIKYITAGVDSSSSAGWGGTRDEERNKMRLV
jgi:2-oxoglutarate dehydrogenase E2 component (dihydrolipoamide succinyltransferase)